MKPLPIPRHPCFYSEAKTHWGRVHLPVAPHCNIQCNYCNRRYDCVNESRPGVTRETILPEDVIPYLSARLLAEPRITVAGIAGPGDPLCEPEKTLDALARVKSAFPDLILCLSTNGLNLMEWMEKLVNTGVQYITLTINAIDPRIGRKIYKWVRLDGQIYLGIEAARILQQRQLECIRPLVERGVTVKVNTVVVPGVNHTHVPEVAREVAKQGAQLMNCLPMIPVPETPFYNLGPPRKAMMHGIKQSAKTYIRQMKHCTRCRADASGLLVNKKKLNVARYKR